MKSIRFLTLTFAFIFSAHAQGTRADASSKGAVNAKPHLTAGFDCRKASSDRERLVCSTPSLLALDGQLQTAYQARRRLLTVEGASLLQASQRSWLKFVDVTCSPSSPDDPPGFSPARCLEDKYKGRLYQIGQVGQRVGPFIFNRVDLFEARVISAPDSEAYLSVHHVAYPQIDAPASASTIEWNREMAKNMSDSCGGESELTDADYQIGLANARMISVQESVEFYSNGPEQPAMESTVSNIVLSPAPRPLEPGDVFKRSADWEKRVQELFVAAFNATPEAAATGFHQTWSVSPLLVPASGFSPNRAYRFRLTYTDASTAGPGRSQSNGSCSSHCYRQQRSFRKVVMSCPTNIGHLEFAVGSLRALRCVSY